MAEAEWLADLIRQHLPAIRAASERADHADRVQVSNESAAAERLTCATQINAGWRGQARQRAQLNEFVLAAALAVLTLPNLFFITTPLLAGRMRRRRLPGLPGPAAYGHARGPVPPQPTTADGHERAARERNGNDVRWSAPSGARLAALDETPKREDR